MVTPQFLLSASLRHQYRPEANNIDIFSEVATQNSEKNRAEVVQEKIALSVTNSALSPQIEVYVRKLCLHGIGLCVLEVRVQLFESMTFLEKVRGGRVSKRVIRNRACLYSKFRKNAVAMERFAD